MNKSKSIGNYCIHLWFEFCIPTCVPRPPVIVIKWRKKCGDDKQPVFNERNEINVYTKKKQKDYS